MRSLPAIALSTCFAVLGTTISSPVAASITRLEPAASVDQEAQVKTLYNNGATLFATADYEGAIEAFTQALKIAYTYGAEPQVLGALLYNIGKSRMKAYEVSRDVSELRQALAIYTRFVDDAKDGAGYTEKDVADAEREIGNIREKLAELDKAREPVAPTEPAAGQTSTPVESTPSDPAGHTETDARRPGIGLAIGGGVAVLAGAGLLIYGATFRPHALDQIEIKRGESVDPADFTRDEDDFYNGEVRTGRILMVTGGVAAGAGAALMILGLTKPRRIGGNGAAAQLTLVPMGPTGLALVGRF